MYKYAKLNDEAQEVGNAILISMEGQAANLTLKKKDEAVTMTTKSLRVEAGAPVAMDADLLFQRFITAAQATELYEKNKRDLFKYELSSFPTALFESPDFMRQPNKASLADELWKIVLKNTIPRSVPLSLPTDLQYVLDGGSLLQRLQAPWKRGNSFQSIIEAYVHFVNCHYPGAVVVWDGYSSGPTTKDMTHLRRSKGLIGRAVHFTPEMTLQSTKEQFLANKENKQRIVFTLGNALEQSCTVIHAKGDADVLMVKEAIKSAKSKPTVLVGEDTDLLILLAHFATVDSHDILFLSDKTGSSKIWSMKELISVLGDLRHQLLFLHAFTGTDTTSRPFGVGKSSALKKLKSCPQLKALAEDFIKEENLSTLQSAGEKVFVLLYGGTLEESLDELRYRLFCSKVAVGTTAVKVNTLPPTSAAARFHSLRVIYQLNEWLDPENTKGLSPTQCGWRIANGRFVPITTDFPAAPADLLKVIRCSCKGSCATKRCSCRKHGLQCSSSCKGCCGVSCSNSPAPDPSLDKEGIDAN